VPQLHEQPGAPYRQAVRVQLRPRRVELEGEALVEARDRLDRLHHRQLVPKARARPRAEAGPGVGVAVLRLGAAGQEALRLEAVGLRELLGVAVEVVDVEVDLGALSVLFTSGVGKGRRGPRGRWTEQVAQEASQPASQPASQTSLQARLPGRRSTKQKAERQQPSFPRAGAHLGDEHAPDGDVLHRLPRRDEHGRKQPQALVQHRVDVGEAGEVGDLDGAVAAEAVDLRHHVGLGLGVGGQEEDHRRHREAGGVLAWGGGSGVGLGGAMISRLARSCW